MAGHCLKRSQSDGSFSRNAARMLGTRRASVTVAAGVLQKAGLISYTCGSLTVLDRERLEEAACDCYGIVQQQLKNWESEIK
jgi:hypothetical protein